MKQSSEGVRRLSLVVGGLAALAIAWYSHLADDYAGSDYRHIPWYFVDPYDSGYGYRGHNLIALAIICALSFAVGWSPVRIVAWVVAGFLKGSTN
jgi:hypothetical protein